MPSDSPADDLSPPHPTDPRDSREALLAGSGSSKFSYDVRIEGVGERAPMRTRRRRILPIALFFATAISVFWAGALQWMPHVYLTNYASKPGISSYLLDSPAMEVRRSILSHWDDGLIYMGCLLAILMTHEMGHFLMTVRYRIAASWPYFLPLPISIVGTLGAVIGMDGLKANRKEIFDIGLAGPLAGLLVCVPVLWVGIGQLDFTQPAGGLYALDLPLVVRWTLAWQHPPGYLGDGQLSQAHLNPYFMAGWVGLLVTGLNMLPVSQLDGGHVIYALFGRRAHWLARIFLALAIAFIVYFRLYSWSIMVLLILIMGTDHPPTRDDTVALGPWRTLLGWTSLLIPVLCFPPAVLYELP